MKPGNRSPIGMAVVLTGVLLVLQAASAGAGEVGKPLDRKRLLVHEWGTFTSLQDEEGRSLSGINVDDEPVPPFVHNLSPFLLGKPILSHEHWAYRMKAAPRRHPLVTMRLETPVLYFYPQHQDVPSTVDVRVEFHGGWLTEFYPLAEADAPGLHDRNFQFGTLTEQTTGSLLWKDLRIGTDGSGPVTAERVWVAPRQVAAANVSTANGESERYLFYRGVGHIDAPLRVLLHRDTQSLEVRSALTGLLDANSTVPIRNAWLVDIRSDGDCAFRTLGPQLASGDPQLTLVNCSYQFAAHEYGTTNLPTLKTAMHQELVNDGLFSDEATAMLNTWERAYFLSPGLRIFYIVPRLWTDAVLPLHLSTAADVQRCMIGRLELISDSQRTTLDLLSKTIPSDDRWIDRIPAGDSRERFLSGRTDFGDIEVEIPADYQYYLALGRFRNALIVHEERKRPQTSLTRFIDNYALHPFRIAPLTETDGNESPLDSGGAP